MKKILLPFLLIPTIILSSCNNNERGFEDPFGEATYNGFEIKSDEMTSRPLTSEEIVAVKNTKDNCDKFDYYLTKEKIEIKERDYLRAFAGEYKQGANVSNKKNDITGTIEKVVTNKSLPEEKYKNHKIRRKISEITTSSTEQYSYGQIDKKETVTTYTHEETTVEGEEKNFVNVFERIKTEKGSVKSVKESKIPVARYDLDDEELLDDGESNYNICQKDYLLDTNIYSGADIEGNVIITEESQEPYNKGAGKDLEGYFILNDGRKYAALNKSLKVTKLKLIKEDKKSTEEEWEDFYLVIYSRFYTETSITSTVIEPNVPVNYLKTPIPLKWKEEKHSFEQGEAREVSDKLPDVDKEEEN